MQRRFASELALITQRIPITCVDDLRDAVSSFAEAREETMLDGMPRLVVPHLAKGAQPELRKNVENFVAGLNVTNSQHLQVSKRQSRRQTRGRQSTIIERNTALPRRGPIAVAAVSAAYRCLLHKGEGGSPRSSLRQHEKSLVGDVPRKRWL